MNSEIQIIKHIFSFVKNIAIVGLSDNPERSSYGVASYLLRAGFTIVPVNPAIEHVFGIPSITSLKDIGKPIDLVNIFRRSEFVPEIVDDAISIGAKSIWMQEGVINEHAAELARANNIPVVMNRCIAVAHRLLL
ncbi:MAG: CoA-binding protein [Ignavibacteria bacterium]|nr:CoA-binding protein [Ignavibacteria bacterium]